MKRVNLMDIAKATGLSKGAVSMALRKRPNIPLHTQERVFAAAQKLGYLPDPLLSALSSYRHSHKKISNIIVFLTNWPTPTGWQDSPFLCRMYQGMQDQGNHLGYQIENFWLTEPGLNHARASQILFQRGVRGLIIPHQPHARVRLRMDWRKFATVAMRSALASPSFHYVNADQYQSIRLAFHHLRHLGYRRPGLAIDKDSDRLSINYYPAGYSVEMATYHPKDNNIPIFKINDIHDGQAIRKWIHKHKPDVILGPANIMEALACANYRVPQDIGCIALDLLTTQNHWESNL
jgi:LacI family transcriptional regulator